ncbi:PTS EIIB type-2 domain-containing protein [Vibrio ordalii]
MKIIAVTACPTGIAHTYMAADSLKKEANKRNISIKVETQGAMGVENPLTVADIVNADLILIA